MQVGNVATTDSALPGGAPGKVFRLASLGGTFEALHSGHLEYLTLGLDLAERVVICITEEGFAQHWKSYNVTSLDRRRARIVAWLNSHCVDESRYEIVPAASHAAIEHALQRPELDLVVCVTEYLAEILEINDRRLIAGLSQFSILVKPLSRRAGRIISSTDVLQGVLFED